MLFGSVERYPSAHRIAVAPCPPSLHSRRSSDASSSMHLPAAMAWARVSPSSCTHENSNEPSCSVLNHALHRDAQTSNAPGGGGGGGGGGGSGGGGVGLVTLVRPWKESALRLSTVRAPYAAQSVLRTRV